MAQAYYNYQEAKWDPKKQSILDFYRKLKSYEETFVNLINNQYFYYCGGVKWAALQKSPDPSYAGHGQ
jgi:hypothetical protein